jgi:hypothetical protein
MAPGKLQSGSWPNRTTTILKLYHRSLVLRLCHETGKVVQAPT